MASISTGTSSSSPSPSPSRIPVTSIPIPSRSTESSYLQTIAFGLLFNSCIIFTNLTQFLFLPLNSIPFTKPYYESLLSYTKLAFGRTLVLISQLFGPTKLVLSWEDQNGNTLDPELFVTRNGKGDIVKVDMPKRSVWMSNHQVYTDWLYLWCVAYYADVADSILIILKASLKHIPFVGWGMQFYRFIFLARSWASDKTYLGRHLSFMTARSRQSSSSSSSSLPKLLLLIFPEGTLISENTQPISRKYAEKNGLEDRKNVLLPRSTGLMFCLRALRREVDDLKLVDFTIGYPGVPPAGYGQSYYTLRSIFMQGSPPPAVHIRCTVTPVSTSPSDLSSTSISSPPPLGVLPNLQPGEADSEEASQEEKEVFDKWLQKRWAHKDGLMEKFYRDGDFNEGEFVGSEAAGEYRRDVKGGKRNGLGNGKKGYVEIPVRLRSNLEIGDAMSWAAPVWVGLGIAFAWKAWSK